MKPQICICCGEPMTKENTLSRNPNVCASCSSLVDGMEDGVCSELTNPPEVASGKAGPGMQRVISE